MFITSGGGSNSTGLLDKTEPNIIASGECGEQGDNVKWTLYDDGLLDITGSGWMGIFADPDTQTVNIPWSDYVSQIKKVNISDGILSIGNLAFQKCTNLTHINIPDSVRYLGFGAFYNCINLKAVNIPDGVDTISENTFMSCGSLKSITIPNRVQYICEYAFWGCSKLQFINVPNSLQYIGKYAFDCGVTDVFYYDATSTDDIDYCTIEDHNYQFENAIKHYGEIYNLDLGHAIAVKNILITDLGTCGDNAKWILYSNGRLDITGSGKISYYTANEHKEQIKEINIGDGITAIENHVFSDCTNLTSVNIPNSVISIGYLVFSDCTSLTSIHIPNSVISIDSNVFRDCTGLRFVNMPNSVQYIDDYAFLGCPDSEDNRMHVYYYEATSEDDIKCTIGAQNDPFVNAVKHYGEIYLPEYDCAVKTAV